MTLFEKKTKIKKKRERTKIEIYFLINFVLKKNKKSFYFFIFPFFCKEI